MVGGWTAKLLAPKCTLGADMLYTVRGIKKLSSTGEGTDTDTGAIDNT